MTIKTVLSLHCSWNHWPLAFLISTLNHIDIRAQADLANQTLTWQHALPREKNRCTMWWLHSLKQHLKKMQWN